MYYDVGMTVMSAEQQTGFTAEIDRRYFQNYIGAVDAIADEAPIKTTDSGIVSRAIDPANVAMVRAELENSAFLDIDGTDEAFGIRTRRVSELVDGPDESTVTLDYDDDTRKLNLGVGPYLYTHACIDPESLREEPNIPNMDLAFAADINIERLREAIEWFDKFTTHVRVGFDSANDSFWMEAMERDRSGSVKTDDGVFEMERGDLDYVREIGEADSHFSLDYFKDIIGAVPENYPVTIRIGEEFPMELSYKIAWDGSSPNEGMAHGEVTFVQAPRIQSD